MFETFLPQHMCKSFKFTILKVSNLENKILNLENSDESKGALEVFKKENSNPKYCRHMKE